LRLQQNFSLSECRLARVPVGLDRREILAL
jgi:hypothetical protein